MSFPYRIIYQKNDKEFLLDRVFNSKYNSFKYIRNHKLNDKEFNYYVITQRSISKNIEVKKLSEVEKKV